MAQAPAPKLEAVAAIVCHGQKQRVQARLESNFLTIMKMRASIFALTVCSLLIGCKAPKAAKTPPATPPVLRWSGYLEYEAKGKPEKDAGVPKTDPNGITYTNSSTYFETGRLELSEKPLPGPDGTVHYVPLSHPVKVSLQVDSAGATYNYTRFRRSERTEKTGFHAVADVKDEEAGKATPEEIQASQIQTVLLDIDFSGNYEIKALGPAQTGELNHSEKTTHTGGPPKYKQPPDSPPYTAATRRAGQSLVIRGKIDSNAPHRFSGRHTMDADDEAPPRTITIRWNFERN